MRGESDAHIAASAAATAAGTTHALKRVGMEDDIIGEAPPEVSNIGLSFAGLPQEEIIRIFHNRFKTINPHHLRHMRGLRYEAFQNQERIGIEGGMLRLRKTSGTFEEFGKSFHEVWGRHLSITPPSWYCCSQRSPQPPRYSHSILRQHPSALQGLRVAGVRAPDGN